MIFGTLPDLFRLTLQTGLMLAQAQQVVAMRLLGAMGVWRLRPGEYTRMLVEKIDAAGDAQRGVAKALGQSKSPIVVARAALDPYARRTGQNARTLTWRGPGRPPKGPGA
ncbi:hypothetical protein [Pararhodobacter marinus]|uniref:hypothetical protein n=1 Tax=Pararhodobacter marinus TaxID=2184063 RepID=UPI0035116745